LQFSPSQRGRYRGGVKKYHTSPYPPPIRRAGLLGEEGGRINKCIVI